MLAVNGRFLGQPLTGVTRYARELLVRLPDHVDGPVVALPPGSPPLPISGRSLPVLPSPLSGARGHLWEQTALAGRVQRSPADLLLSLCNTGPLAVTAQVVAVLDLAAIVNPQWFSPVFTRLWRVLLPQLTRRCRRVAVPSEGVRTQLCGLFGVDPGRVDVIPGGVGPPFLGYPVDDLPRRRGGHCVMVGGHQLQKNLPFLLELWPRVKRELDLDLHVTVRRSYSPRRKVDVAEGTPGVVVHNDVDDASLAALYADALCVLSPSHFEGFGLPLLEAMAVGTPFLSTDTGAAVELAVTDGQVLPLDPERWMRQLRRWRGDDLIDVRRRSVGAAATHTWDESARLLAGTCGAAVAG